MDGMLFAVGAALLIANPQTLEEASKSSGVDPLTVTASEYQLYRDWVNAQDDPRLEKYSERARLRKVARSLGVHVKDLQSAIDRVTPVADKVAFATEEAITSKLAQTPLKGMAPKAIVDAREGHVIAFVKWRCGSDERDRDKEAAYAAWAAAQGGNVVKTIGLWCVNQIDTKLFSAKLAREGAAKISKTSIERFASTRYVRMFEDVRRGPHR